jgi:hypothetical protein
MSIVALAAGIASLVLMLFSLMPMLGWCTAPISALCAALALIMGLASLVRTTINPKLEGRWQALAGLFFALLWGGGAAILLNVLSRH